MPIYQTANFEYADFDHKLRVSAGEEAGYLYTRYANPTVDALAEALIDLEDGEAAVCLASGMAAVSSSFQSLVGKGDHVLASSVLYGGTFMYLTEFLARQDVSVTFVDVWDMQAVEAAFRPETRVLYLEPMMNPTLRIADVPQLSRMAHERDVFVLTDNTFTPPNLFRPLCHGADAALHSTTKFIGGHGDTIGGAVIGSKSFIEKVNAFARVSGCTMSPFDAWLTLRGLRTLDVRLERSCRNARVIAAFLSDQPRVRRVHYPGLESHPEHALSERLFSDSGCLVSFDLAGGLDAARTVSDAFRVITSTVSLGEVDTVASHPASSSHKSMAPEVRAKYGITDGLIRLSVGIEDPDDLKEDLGQALGGI